MLIRLVALSETIKTYPKNVLRLRFLIAIVSFCILLYCPLVLDVCRFFLPLILSTVICSTSVYWFIFSRNNQAGRDNIGEASLYNEVMLYNETDDAEVGRTLTNTFDELVGDDCFEKADATEGKLPMLDESDGDCEEISALAESVWNVYFGRYSRWNYTAAPKDCVTIGNNQETTKNSKETLTSTPPLQMLVAD